MSTIIWVVFLGKPKGVEGWPYKEFDCEERKRYLLKRLKERCKEIEFVGGDIIESFAKPLSNYRYSDFLLS
jgi:hypothetical protein